MITEDDDRVTAAMLPFYWDAVRTLVAIIRVVVPLGAVAQLTEWGDRQHKALEDSRDAMWAVFEAVNAGEIEMLHWPYTCEVDGEQHDCPEDDTCTCAGRAVFAQISAAYDSALELTKVAGS